MTSQSYRSCSSPSELSMICISQIPAHRSQAQGFLESFIWYVYTFSTSTFRRDVCPFANTQRCLFDPYGDSTDLETFLGLKSTAIHSKDLLVTHSLLQLFSKKTLLNSNNLKLRSHDIQSRDNFLRVSLILALSNILQCYNLHLL